MKPILLIETPNNVTEETKESVRQDVARLEHNRVADDYHILHVERNGLPKDEPRLSVLSPKHVRRLRLSNTEKNKLKTNLGLK